MAWILAAKLLGLLLIYVLFFSPEQRTNVDPAGVQAHFFSSDVERSSGEQ